MAANCLTRGAHGVHWHRRLFKGKRSRHFGSHYSLRTHLVEGAPHALSPVVGMSGNTAALGSDAVSTFAGIGASSAPASLRRQSGAGRNVLAMALDSSQSYRSIF